MINNLSGIVSIKKETYAVINVGGVGFKVFLSGVSMHQLPQVGHKADILTHLHVREDELSLYGFLNEDELEFFEALISISGIGPRSAMSVMSLAPVERLRGAIASGEAELLRKSSGIGRKIADRIILELKDKIRAGSVKESVRIIESDSDVYKALTSLGYEADAAKSALAKVNPEVTGTKERLRAALKILKPSDK